MQVRRILITSAKFMITASSLLLMQSCHTKNKEKEEETEWSATMCAPIDYPISGPHVYFFNKGKKVGMTEALLGIYQNWVITASARSSGRRLLPDSIFVSYFAPNDHAKTFYYEGGSRLPANKIKTLFREGYQEGKKHEKFNEIRTGLAPGGRVCIWVNHVEIFRFKAAEKGQYSDSLLVSTSIAKHHVEYQRTLTYIKNHPIDYSIWEKPDVRYDLDFGFCNEANNTEFVGYNFYSKEGGSIHVSRGDVNITQWGKPYGKPVDFFNSKSYQSFAERKIKDNKLNFPVQMYVQWKKDKVYYSTDVLFPKEIEEKFNKAYFNSEIGKKSNYNRIVFGVEKDGEHCTVWLDGPGKQEKIMRFKGVVERKLRDSESYATEVTYY